MDEIEQAIQEALASLPAEAAAGNWTWRYAIWTREVKERLTSLARRVDSKLHVCASGCLGARYGEWLYDVCWYRQDEHGLRSLPLVAECEWGPDGGHDGDFQKLLQARAERRLWIFEQETAAAVREIFSECRDAIKYFADTQAGDRYLLAGIAWNPRIFHFEHYIHA